jgi:putative RNA 2'-phosphotransferase
MNQEEGPANIEEAPDREDPKEIEEVDDLEDIDDTEEDEEREPVVFDQEKQERLSRFLALVLRHRAHHFDMEMNDEGFVFVDDLLDVIDERQQSLDWVEFEHIEALTQTEGRKRFEVRNDQVRATYGHSFKRPIRYELAEPPAKLYVGTAQSKMAGIRQHGVQPAGRQYVHLSEEYDEAMIVAQHQGDDAVVLTVNATEAHKAGTPFYKPTNGIYLVSSIKPEFLDIGVEYGRRGRRGSRRR